MSGFIFYSNILAQFLTFSSPPLLLVVLLVALKNGSSRLQNQLKPDLRCLIQQKNNEKRALLYSKYQGKQINLHKNTKQLVTWTYLAMKHTHKNGEITWYWSFAQLMLGEKKPRVINIFFHMQLSLFYTPQRRFYEQKHCNYCNQH